MNENTVKPSFYKWQACDGQCGRIARTRRLPMSDVVDGSTAAVNLCSFCWREEMHWREKMNVNHNLGAGRSAYERGHELFPVYPFYAAAPDGAVSEYADLDELEAVQAQEMSWKIQENTDKHDAEFDGTNAIESVSASATMDEITANPRVVVLYDRINGSTVLDQYAAFIVRDDREMPTLYARRPHPMSLAKETFKHADNHFKNSANLYGVEYVVVVLPISDLRAGFTTDTRNYAERIGRQVLLANKRAFAEKLQEKE